MNSEAVPIDPRVLKYRLIDNGTGGGQETNCCDKMSHDRDLNGKDQNEIDKVNATTLIVAQYLDGLFCVSRGRKSFR